MPAPALTPPRPLDVVWLVASAGLFASSFVATEVALSPLSPWAVTAGRLLVGAAALLAVTAGQGPPRPPVPVALGAGLGLLYFALPYSLFAHAQTALTGADTAALVCLGPVVATVVASVFLDDERPRLATLGVLAAGCAGGFVIVGRTPWSTGLPLGPALLVVAALASYAAAGVLIRRAAHLGPVRLAAHGAGYGALFAAGAWALVDGTMPADPEAAGAVAWLGLGPTAAALSLRAWQAARHGVRFVSTAGWLMPAFGIALSAILLDEQPRPSALVGVAVVGAAVVGAARTGVR